MNNRLRQGLRAAPAIAGLVAAIVGLHLLARTGLRGPAGVGSVELAAWVDDPVAAIATVIRWVALILAYYLLVVCCAVALLREDLDQTPLKHVVPAGLAPTLGVLLGVGAVAGPFAAHVSRTADAVPAAQSEALVLRTLDGPLRITTLDTSEFAAASHPMIDARRAIDQTESAIPDPERDSVWVVEPGESFWSIAEETLRDHWRVTMLTDVQIADYWRDLIDVNRDRLVEPGNPDLVYPGQELYLPDPPPRPPA